MTAFSCEIMKLEEYDHYFYFKTPSRWAEKCLLVSDGMGYTADRKFRIDRKSFYNYLAFYVHAGTFYIEQYNQTFVLHKGDVGILNLMDTHVYYSDLEDVTHLLGFHFRGAGMGSLMERLKQNDRLPCLCHIPDLEEVFVKNFSLTRSGCSEMELAGHMYGVLMRILEHVPLSFAEDIQIPVELQRTAGFMEEQVHTNLTLDQISAYAGMGKYHFSHMFKKWYGISPMQYYTSKRMEQACDLLQKSVLSVEEIAEQLGYLDSGYFRKAFKNYFGLTPTAYRKQVR